MTFGEDNLTKTDNPDERINITMQTINLFFAASASENEDELIELSDYINELNTVYRHKGIYFCMNDSRDLAKITDELERESRLRNNRLFVIFLYKNAESEALKAFDTALNEFRKKGFPKIITFFRQTKPGEDRGEEVLGFMKRLDKQLGHFYSFYDDISTVKLTILLELARDSSLNINADMEDLRVGAEGVSLFDANNIPIYANNPRLRELREKKEELEERYTKAQNQTENNETALEKLKLSGEINRLNEEIKITQRDILSLAQTITACAFSGKNVSERIKAAYRLFEKGDYDGVKVLLTDEKREEQLTQAMLITGQAQKIMGGYIEENLLLIKTLCAEGINTESLPAITALYGRCEQLTEEYALNKDFYYTYAYFLTEQKEYAKAKEICGALEKDWEARNVSKVKLAAMYNLLGNLMQQCNDLNNSEKYYLKAMEIRESLAEESPEQFREDISECYNNLGLIYRDKDLYERSEEMLLKCIGIRLLLCEAHPGNYESSLADAYNSIGAVYYSMKRYDLCEKAWDKALKIREELYKNQSEKLIKDLAQSYNNMGILYTAMNRRDTAEGYLIKAVEYTAEMAKDNPAAYEAELALRYASLALLYDKAGKKECEEVYLKALAIQERLFALSPEIYRESLVSTNNNLGAVYLKASFLDKAQDRFNKCISLSEGLSGAKLLFNMANAYGNLGLINIKRGNLPLAEKQSLKALEMRLELYARDKLAYGKGLIEGYYGMGNINFGMKCFDKAEEYYESALKICRSLSEKDNPSLKADTAKIYNNLGTVYALTSRSEKALDIFKEMVDIYEKLYGASPEIYRKELMRSYENMCTLTGNMGLADSKEFYGAKLLLLKDAQAADQTNKEPQGE